VGILRQREVEVELNDRYRQAHAVDRRRSFDDHHAVT
jgi:hypothetical protein